MSLRPACLLLASALALVCVPGSSNAQFAPPALDHFTVYDAVGHLTPPAVLLQDQLGLQRGALGQTRLFLVPAQKNAEPLLDPQSHLTCYDLAGQPPQGVPQVVATHQFGTQTLNLGTALYGCIPTEKYPPQPISIDHFICYAASGTAIPAGALFTDQFYPATHTLLDPFLFCAPAEKTLPATGQHFLVEDPLSHLVCFNITPQGPPPQVPGGLVPIRNQFGSDEITLGVRRAVCLPATKNVPPPGALDHFVYYDAAGPDGPPVTVVDQFGSQPSGLDLGPVVSFLVPVNKNSEGLVDPVSHLTGYVMPGNPPPATMNFVRVTNQFGVRNLKLGAARQLLVPTQKLIGQQGDVTIDHFACYDAQGTSIRRGVTLLDQFHPAAITRQVAEPFLFCNPADKNGEGIINVDDHLACYRTNPTGTPIGQVPILNQFSPAGGGQTLINVAADVALCVPSKKEINHIEVPGLPVWAISLGFALFAGTGLMLIRRRQPARIA